MFRGWITYPVHAALEMAAAAALIAVPIAIGLPVAAIVTAGAIGALLFGLACSATGHDERGTLPVSAHAAYDAAVAFALIAAAIAFGVAGQQAALAFLLAAGLFQLLLNVSTRYSAASA